MKKKKLILINTCCYFNPITLYWFDFAYQGLLDLALALGVSFCSSTILLSLFIRFKLFKSRLKKFIFFVITSWIVCLFVLTAHSIEAGLGLAGYKMHGDLIIAKYLLIMLMMPTFWINILCFTFVNYIEKDK